MHYLPVLFLYTETRGEGRRSFLHSHRDQTTQQLPSTLGHSNGNGSIVERRNNAARRRMVMMVLRNDQADRRKGTDELQGTKVRMMMVMDAQNADIC